MDRVRGGPVKRHVLALAILFATPAHAQLVFSVCRETCPDPLRDPGGAAMCHARIAACETKLTLYNGYMSQLNAGVTTYQLPALYRELLQPFYNNNLGNWRFGFSDRQPANNATTDCTVTYFNRQNFVNLLRDGRLDGLWNWLFHELAHFDQCRLLGTRDAYAKMWFGHLEVAFIQNNNLETLHDRMMMEGSAETVAGRVVDRTRPLRDVSNRLVRPISVSLRNAAGQTLGDRITIVAGGNQRVTAVITGGSDPLVKSWRWMTPANGYYTMASARVLDDGNAFNIGASTTGVYKVMVHVGQEGSNLVPGVKELIVEVVPPRQPGTFVR
jgi:hypothetical protein